MSGMLWLWTRAVLAGDIPAPVQAWSDGLTDAYGHYAQVEPAWEPVSDTFPPCPQPGEPIPDAPRSSMSDAHRAAWAKDATAEAARCAALRPGGWRLQLRLTPHDQRIFSPLVLRVSEVAAGQSAENVVAELVSYGVWASKGAQALVPVGPYVVEVDAPCGAGGIFAYDLADAVAAAMKAVPSKGVAPPKQVAVSACGRISFALVSLSDVQEDAQRPREYWGFDFPERRDLEKAAHRETPGTDAEKAH